MYGVLPGATMYGVLPGPNWNDDTNDSKPNISHCAVPTEPMARMAELLAEMGCAR